jgi:DNA-directed RNA polymerase subunit M/transcription elongation factor TFIIS
MKLRQKEFCHNCQKEVIFEFEDINERQVINCPNCGHEHYRELDDATILDIRIDQTRGLGQFAVAKMPEVSLNFCNEDEISYSLPLAQKVYNIKGYDENGRPILDGDPMADGFDVGTRQTKVITERRWGRDPNQRG